MHHGAAHCTRWRRLTSYPTATCIQERSISGLLSAATSLIGISELEAAHRLVKSALHLLCCTSWGHGLGFLGSMRAGGECSGNPSWGCYGISGYPLIYDHFTENGAGTALLSYTNNSTDLGDQLTSGDLYFNSPGGNFANGGNRVPIYAPPTWSQGSRTRTWGKASIQPAML